MTARLALLLTLGSLANASIATAQTISPIEQIAFARPEAWAMKYFTSATSLNGLQSPTDLERGALAIGLEGGWLPKLSPSQELVGFNGTSPEDLNQAPGFLRPRIAYGLGRDLVILAAYDPPIHAFGVTPHLLALGLDGIISTRGPWRIGWRAHGQIGHVTAAVTCPSSAIAFPPGSPGNPVGCTEESADVTSLRYIGGEVNVARRIGHGFVPHAAVGVNFIDTVFQTNAAEYGVTDHTRLLDSGVTVAATVGFAYQIASRVSVAADFFYSPLTVQRTASSPVSIDPMMNARAIIMYEVIR